MFWSLCWPCCSCKFVPDCAYHRGLPLVISAPAQPVTSETSPSTVKVNLSMINMWICSGFKISMSSSSQQAGQVFYTIQLEFEENIKFILYAIYKSTSRFVMLFFSQQAGQVYYTSQFEFATSFITFSVRYQAETKY